MKIGLISDTHGVFATDVRSSWSLSTRSGMPETSGPSLVLQRSRPSNLWWESMATAMARMSGRSIPATPISSAKGSGSL